MRKTLSVLLLAASIAAPGARADEEEVIISSDQAGTVSSDDTGGHSMIAARDVNADNYLANEIVGIRPQAGIILFDDQAGSSTSRAAYGATLDVNLNPGSSLFIGPSTGVIFSHLGSPGSNFFGSNSGNNLPGGSANLLLLPANLKIGTNLGDSFRVSARGGANVTYRSESNALFLGTSTNVGNDAVWSLYPNIGADLEWGSGNFGVILRPDYTITPGNNFFTGTLGISLGLG